MQVTIHVNRYDKAIKILVDLHTNPEPGEEENSILFTCVDALHLIQATRSLDSKAISWQLQTIENENEYAVYPHIVPKTDADVYYQIAAADNSFQIAHDGYSKYYERLTLYREDKLQPGEIMYGYEQALDHLKELQAYVDKEGKRPYLGVAFVVIIETRVQTRIPV